MDLKLGKKPATHDARDLQLAKYLDLGALPPLPPSFGRQSVVKDWGMLGNDRYGDCVWAGAAHEVELWTRESSTHPDASFTDAAVLSDYAACTGFDPATGAGDNGTDMRQAAGYRRSTGIVDSKGNRHRIYAYTAIAPGNEAHLEMAAYLFSAVGIGIEFPASAMDQFNAGKPWDYVSGSTIEGGHYVPGVGKLKNGNLAVVTWGRLQEVTPRFLAHYCDEAFAYLSRAALTNGKSPDGFDLTTLKADMALVAS